MNLDLSKLTPAPWYAHNPDDRFCMNVFCVTNSPHEPDTENDDTTGVIAGTLLQTPLTLGRWHDNWEADTEFIALARNAFDVMMRRGWSPERMGDTWVVNDEDGRAFCHPHDQMMRWPDPFTALVEADEWYRENVESPEKICHN